MSLNELMSDIIAFRHYLRSERGLSENTTLAYNHDLERYAQWTVIAKLPNYLAPSLSDVSMCGFTVPPCQRLTPGRRFV